MDDCKNESSKQAKETILSMTVDNGDSPKCLCIKVLGDHNGKGNISYRLAGRPLETLWKDYAGLGELFV